MITSYQLKILEGLKELNKTHKHLEYTIITEVLYELAKEHMATE